MHHDVEGRQNEVERAEVQDIALYRTQSFATWKCFMIRDKTAWWSPKLWSVMRRMAVVSLAVAIFTTCTVRNPSALNVGQVTDVSKFLNVVIGLLMGFFMSFSLTRWYSCMDGFLQLLDSIRNLQMQLMGLGVPSAETSLCVRYGLLSAWMMYFTLLGEHTGDTVDAVFTKLQVQTPRLRRLREKGVRESPLRRAARKSLSLDLTESELCALRGTSDPAEMVWVWVGGLVGRLAQDGFIPPMVSPTYGRIMDLCQQAHSSIREIKSSTEVQPPLLYTHMMSGLVHVNNILNAVTFGMVLGLSFGTMIEFLDMHPFWRSTTEGNIQIAHESHRDWQTASITLTYCFLGPAVYQAILLVCLELAQPFESEDTSIPFDRFLVSLERDLQDASMVASQMAFESPCFKPPRRSSAGIVPAELLAKAVNRTAGE